MKGSPIARGSSCGRVMASVAEPHRQSSSCLNRSGKPHQKFCLNPTPAHAFSDPYLQLSSLGPIRRQIGLWGVAASAGKRMAPQVGLEPTTLRLTAGCSAIELLRSGVKAGSGRNSLVFFLVRTHHSISLSGRKPLQDTAVTNVLGECVPWGGERRLGTVRQPTKTGRETAIRGGGGLSS